jgi:carbamoyltransferase
LVVLGLGFTDHEASAAIVVDGRLATGIARERLTRIKKDGKMWGSERLDLSPAIRYCLDAHGMTLSDVDLLVWNHIDHVSTAEVSAVLSQEGSMILSDLPLLVLPHHFAHACSAFYLSPFSEAAVLVADGSGGPLDGLKLFCDGPEPIAFERGSIILQNLRSDQSEIAREHESFYYCDGQEWQPLRKIVGHWSGIGAEFGSVSELLFGDCLHAGKTMGLAPYGKPQSRTLFLEPSGPEDMPAFKSVHSPERDALEEELRFVRDGRGSFDYLALLPSVLAASVQFEVEKALLAHVHWLHHRTQSPNLCLAGGVALNCVANSRLAMETGFDATFVPPAPGDDGVAIGCALYGAALSGELKRGFGPVYLGRSYSHEAKDLEALGLVPFPQSQNVYESIAERLAAGAVVAWYQAGAEMGPRALGHRSFLADPRNCSVRDYLNKVVKNREMFRPFAPVVLEYAVEDYFEEHYPSYFMSFVARVREEKRSIVPAITHVDGTARYQVLRKLDNPELYELIAAFARLTGIPILLNTSLNRAGEPIVETPLQAAQCMLASSVDYLVVDGLAYGRVGSRV